MADNVDITPGTGATVAADEIAGVKYQRVKLGLGADGTAVDAGAGAGAVGTDTQRVTLGSDDPAVASLAVLDDWDESDRAKVNPIVGQAGVQGGSGAVSATTQRVVLATDVALPTGTNVVGKVGIDQTTPGTTNLVASGGDIAHDAADSGNPVKIGHKAIAHGANPTAVAANDRTDSYANRHGIPWVIGGHPNVITRSATIDDSDGAQTDASLLTVSAGTKIVVTAISAICSSANTGDVGVRIGFAAATLAAASESGAAGILLEGKFAAGGGNQKGNGAGIIGVGGDGEDLRISCDDPAGGSLFVTFSYYTVES